MMKTATSREQNPHAAARALREALGGDVTCVLYFGSSTYDQEALAAAMRESFPRAQLFGCSTAGEIVTGQVLKNSVVAMALDADILEDVCIQVVRNLSDDASLDAALQGLADHAGRPLTELPVDRYVGLVLVDGLSGAEERLMERLGARTDVMFVGGSAGDDLAFQRTHVHAQGHAFTNAAVLALLKPRGGFSVLKTQSFRALHHKLTATAVREAERLVLEFNGQPAARAYADALGVTVEQLPNLFMRHPVGLMVHHEPYVRSPQRVQDGGVKFYCQVLQGMELSVLEAGDIVADTARALEERKRQAGPVRGIINFNCILRTLELEKNKQTEAYARLFADVPTVGFSTYGEEYIGHVNQTATMLLLK
ncbi:MAG: FIST N-terminal domain-containing protein [Myxococcota bacterium]